MGAPNSLLKRASEKHQIGGFTFKRLNFKTFALENFSRMYYQ